MRERVKMYDAQLGKTQSPLHLSLLKYGDSVDEDLEHILTSRRHSDLLNIYVNLYLNNPFSFWIPQKQYADKQGRSTKAVTRCEDVIFAFASLTNSHSTKYQFQNITSFIQPLPTLAEISPYVHCLD